MLAIGPFFIMSGLFLYRPFVRVTLGGAKRPALGQFFARRVARLLPGFWLVVAFCLLLINFNSIDGLWYVLRPFLLLEIYDYQYYAGLDVVWTVPTEVQFYLALPIFAAIGHLLARGGKDPAAKARRMMSPLVLLVLVQLGWNVYVYGSFENWPPQYFYPFSVSGLFAIGMALAIWTVQAEVQPEKEPKFFALARKRPNWFWLGALGMYAISCVQPFAVAGTADWISPEAAVVRAALLLAFSALIMVPLVVPKAASRTMTKMLSGRVMQFLGRISYGLYLWHFAVMYMIYQSGSIFGELIPVQMQIGRFGFWELLVPTLLGTIAVATVSYYLVERPAFTAVERYYKRKNTPPPAAQLGERSAPPEDPGVAKAA